MIITGIYFIQSRLKRNRLYVGSAVNVGKRWSQHLYQLRKKKHHAIKLQRHYNRYGEVDLLFSIVKRCKKEKLIEIEQEYLDEYKPYFNSRPKANSQLGFRHSKESNHKNSLAHKGNKIWVGRKHKEESKRKMRLAKLGRKATLATKKKLSLVRMGNKNALGNKNRLGVGFSEESRKKISEGLKRYYNKLKSI